MKTKTALIAIFIVIAVAAGALVMQNQAQTKLRQENAELRQQSADQLAGLQAENERLSNQVAQAAGSQLSQDQLRELVKLRGEVARLRNQVGQLQTQGGELEKLREENRQLREPPAAQAAPAPGAPPIDPVAAQNACINNLRLIDTAKQQCAAEHNLKVTETVTAEQLLPYLAPSGLKEFPKCPAGGTYTVGPIGFKPTCSIPGHVLP